MNGGEMIAFEVVEVQRICREADGKQFAVLPFSEGADRFAGEAVRLAVRHETITRDALHPFVARHDPEVSGPILPDGLYASIINPLGRAPVAKRPLRIAGPLTRPVPGANPQTP
jgi:hypothetical protein